MKGAPGACRASATRAGFSLVEVLAAVLILGIGVVGITEGIVTAVRSARDGEVQTAAVLYAEGVIETLRAEGYLTDGVSDGECTDVLESCRWRRTIAPTELEGLHDITVVIETRRDGKQVCELRTLLFEKPTDTPTRDREKQRDRDSKDRRRGGGSRRG